MANKTVYEIIAKAIGFGKTDKSVKTLTGSMKRFATGLVTAAAAYKGFSEAVDAVKLAGRIEGVERAFDKMRRQAGFSAQTLSKLDTALDGTADKLTIMEQANNAMLLGIVESEDQMAEMFDIAQRLSTALGNTAEFGITSLVTGLGRQSKLMLDNLGIMVDVEGANKDYAESLGKTVSQLTDAERKQAFVNEALAEGKRLVEMTGEETITTAQKFDQFTTAMTSLKETIGTALIDTGIIDSLTELGTGLQDLINFTVDAMGVEKNQSKAMKELNEEISKQESTLSDLETQLFAIDVIYKNVETSASEWNKTFDENVDLLKDLDSQGLMGIEVRQQMQEEFEKELEFLAILMQDKKQLLEAEEETAQTQADIAQRRKEQQQEEIERKKEEAAILEKLDAVALKNEDKRQKRVKDRIATEKENKKMILQTLDSMKIISDQLGIDNKALEKVTIAHAVANTFAGATKALAQGGIKGFVGAAAVVAAGMQNVERIKQSYQSYEEGGLIGGNRHSQGGTVIEAEQGEFIMSRNAVENIGVDTLETMNAGGGSVVVNVTGNVMSEDFVENELADKISIAVKRGVDFGIV